MSYMLGSDRIQKKTANKSQFTLQMEEVNTLRKQNKELKKEIRSLKLQKDALEKENSRYLEEIKKITKNA